MFKEVTRVGTTCSQSVSWWNHVFKLRPRGYFETTRSSWNYVFQNLKFQEMLPFWKRQPDRTSTWPAGYGAHLAAGPRVGEAFEKNRTFGHCYVAPERLVHTVGNFRTLQLPEKEKVLKCYLLCSRRNYWGRSWFSWLWHWANRNGTEGFSQPPIKRIIQIKTFIKPRDLLLFETFCC